MNFKWAYDWMGKQKWKLIASIILNVIGVALMTYEPYIFSDIVDDVLMPQQFEQLFAGHVHQAAVGVLAHDLREVELFVLQAHDVFLDRVGSERLCASGG